MGRRKKKAPKRRVIKLVGTDIELEVTKVTAIRTQAEMIHLDKMPDGTWRLTYNELHIPDFTKIESLDIIRDEKV